MDGAGGPTRGAVAAEATVSVAASPRLEAYKRDEVEALVAEALRTRAALREQLDDARHEALARQVPEPLEVVPRTDADDALRQLEGELVQLRSQLAAAQANVPVELQPTVAVPVVAAVAPVVQRVVVERPYAKATGLLQVVTWSVIVAVVLVVLLAWFA